MSPRRFRSLQDPDALRSLVANLREAIYITDMRGNVLDANPAFFQLLGVRGLDDLKAYGANEMVVDPSRRLAEMDMVERDGFVRDFELQLLRPDGMMLTVLDTMYAVQEAESGETIYHGILVDITQRKQLEEELRQQSVRDPLTGCYNRRHLADLDAVLSPGDESWGCLFIDIDHFKQYNDEYGHQMGDNTLIRMSRFLMRQVRAEEPVVRVGGDEFVIVLRGARQAQVEMVAERMRIAALRTAPVPFSLGWAVREPGESLTSTVNRADQNLLAVRVIERTPTRVPGKGEDPAAS
ncbi:sensor domain-containing diguanylate cyclase [Pseudogemmatithrix spongiicola]|uniref:diguanylate cyclase n=1 Tax=Pseudogemmatithrix spongiicola TaxID=3062599 RepID=A0AA49Q5S9_9BACT|nr:sensor domain-containing diguanylate cyclase [Gemmatimonadaceae bacterium 'strain 138']